MRSIFVAIAAATGSALQVYDSPGADLVVQSGVVSALDPELTNVAGQTFHVTTPGQHDMIVLPNSQERNAGSALKITADIEQLGSSDDCDDLVIRSVKITGSRLGTDSTGAKIATLEFFVASDAFPANVSDNSAIGITLTLEGGSESTLAVDDFLSQVPMVKIVRPTGNVHVPTRQSYRHRSRIFHASMSLKGLEEAHDIDIWWSTVWRGYDETTDPWGNIYLNDLSFTVSGMSKEDPSGLLGSDDHSAVAKQLPNCFKKQPVGGPYQPAA